MDINQKLIYIETKDIFTSMNSAGELKNSSVVFIGDTGELWTHGKMFGINLSSEIDKIKESYQSATYYYTGASATAAETTTKPNIIGYSSNSPISGNFYYFDTKFYHSQSTTSNRHQMAYGYQSNDIYSRYYYGGKWSAWSKIVLDSDLSKYVTKDTEQSITGSKTFSFAFIKPIYASNINDCYKDGSLAYYRIGNYPENGFPAINNGNSVLWLGNHPGNFGSQLVTSSDGNIYYRYINNGIFNNKPWKKLVFADDFVNSIYEANLKWGGKNISNGVSPIDAALLPELNANRLACYNGAYIDIEYSKDGGKTWIDYGLTDYLKSAVFTNIYNVYAGGPTSSSEASALKQLRITIKKNPKVYCNFLKFAILMSTNGATGCTITISKSLNSSPTTFSDVTTSSLSGWTGWNIIQVPKLIFGDDRDSNINSIRFTFKCSGNLESNPASRFCIAKIRGIGVNCWVGTNTYSSDGQAYSVKSDGAVVFDNNITSNKFITYGGSSSQLLLGNGKLINKNSFDGSSGYVKSAGIIAAVSGTTMLDSGIRLKTAYNNGYPESYGNVLGIADMGCSELFMGWRTHNLYYRFKSNQTTASWSNWARILTTSDTNIAATSAKTKQLLSIDDRDIIYSPSDIVNGISMKFQHNVKAGIGLSSYYSGIVNFRPYGGNTTGTMADFSGGPTHQLAFNMDSKIYYRTGDSNGWTSWKKIATEGDYLPISGGNVAGNINPNSNTNYSLGTKTNRWNFIYSKYVGDWNYPTNCIYAETFYLKTSIIPMDSLTANIGNTSHYFNNIYSKNFIKFGSNDNYVLLGGGGHKALSEFSTFNPRKQEFYSALSPGNNNSYGIICDKTWNNNWFRFASTFLIQGNFGSGILHIEMYGDGTKVYSANAQYSGSITKSLVGIQNINHYIKIYYKPSNRNFRIYYNYYNNQGVYVRELYTVESNLKIDDFSAPSAITTLPTSEYINIHIDSLVESSINITAPAFYESSDRGLKENIKSIDNIEYSKLKNIDLKEFNFKKDSTKKYGVIAQDLEEIGLGNLVQGEEGSKSVDYISLLILEIQRLRNEIKNIKKQIPTNTLNIKDS